MWKLFAMQICIPKLYSWLLFPLACLCLSCSLIHRQLGDDIESRHGGLIEEFLQKAVTYAMQEKLSFKRFSKLSQELAVQAHRVQEQTLLVACFGRRLWEKLPEYQDTISNFTALSVEEIASDFFLSMVSLCACLSLSLSLSLSPSLIRSF